MVDVLHQNMFCKCVSLFYLNVEKLNITKHSYNMYVRSGKERVVFLCPSAPLTIPAAEFSCLAQDRKQVSLGLTNQIV